MLNMRQIQALEMVMENMLTLSASRMHNLVLMYIILSAAAL